MAEKSMCVLRKEKENNWKSNIFFEAIKSNKINEANQLKAIKIKTETSIGISLFIDDYDWCCFVKVQIDWIKVSPICCWETSFNWIIFVLFNKGSSLYHRQNCIMYGSVVNRSRTRHEGDRDVQDWPVKAKLTD